jgi:nucleoside 2-deoxyribosyltransferase
MPKKIYLASPYGFSSQQKQNLLPEFVQTLESLGAEVWEPFERNNQIDRAEEGWAYQIGQADLRDVQESDAIFAIVNGTPPDDGVMVELGAAIALGKKTFLFRDDFRRCTDSEHYPLNLMLFTGLPEHGWEDYYYTSIEEIPNPEKALVSWLRESPV